jgi:hypothetical protein
VRVLVLDTGPLYEYFKALYASRLPGQMPGDAPIKTRPELEVFRDFLGSYNRRVTVPGVAVELSRHFRSDKVRAAAMWRDHVSLMKELEIEERHIPASDLNVEHAALDGPVDVALWAVARQERASHQDVLVLTIEQNVSKWMARSESAVKTLSQVMHELRST